MSEALPGLNALLDAAVRSGAAGTGLACLLLALAIALCRGLARDPAQLRRGQEVVMPLLAGSAAFAAWRLAPFATWILPGQAYALAAGAAVFAFLTLVFERHLAAREPAGAARPLALFLVLSLAAAAILLIGQARAIPWTGLAMQGLAWLMALVALELTLRALGRWFLPADPRKAALDSVLVVLVTAPFAKGGLAAPLRAQFGLDFSRSFALRYVRRAAPVAALATALFCWGLSGARLIPLEARGVYERFGQPDGVLQPGIHFVLPWPFGRVRMVENGAVHELALGGEAGGLAGPAPPAEAPPPLSANRLWGGVHPAEADYLIASVSGTRQEFQVISADLRVLWRVGMTDQDAARFVYGATDPQTLIRADAAHLVTRVFAASRLEALLGQRRETLAEDLRRELVADLARDDAGVELVGVVIEAVHPPAGAAAAYRAVQAAGIEAATTVAAERGRAREALSLAGEERDHLLTAAAATTAEITGAARADAARFAAERQADAAGSQVFRFERYLSNLADAVRKAPLTLIDSGLPKDTAPSIDFRPFANQTTPLSPKDPD